MKIVIRDVNIDFDEYKLISVDQLINAIKKHFNGCEFVKNVADDPDNFHTGFSFKKAEKEAVYEYQWIQYAVGGFILDVSKEMLTEEEADDKLMISNGYCKNEKTKQERK